MSKLAIVFLATSLVVMTATNALADDQANGLTMTVAATQTKGSEAPAITIEIQNPGDAPATLVHPDYWGVTTISITDAAGQAVEPAMFKAKRKAVQSWLEVPPGNAVEFTYRDATFFNCCAGHRFEDLASGSYTVTVEIVNPAVDVDPPKDGAASWSGTLKASTELVVE